MLSKLKVLDFSTLLPGPYASLMLADLGADVLRVESPSGSDLVRSLPPLNVNGQSSAHSYLNRNKKSIALNLKSPQCIEIVYELVQQYDIILEQFRPGVMGRLGLDYAALKKINPSIIYCSITGYGQTGPLKNRAGHDINYLALSGVSDYSRRKNEKPLPLGVQYADLAGGSHHAVMGILAAVIQRTASGEGQYLDISMTDCIYSMNSIFSAGYLSTGIEPTPEGTFLNGANYYDYYETSDARFMSVGSLEPKFLIQLCEATGLTHLINKAGSQIEEEQMLFKKALKEVFLGQEFNYWCKLFSSLDCCVEPVLTLAEASNQPHAMIRHWTETTSIDSSKLKQPSNPILKTTNIKSIGGPIGINTKEILTDLGYSKDKIEGLLKNKDIR